MRTKTTTSRLTFLLSCALPFAGLSGCLDAPVVDDFEASLDAEDEDADSIDALVIPTTDEPVKEDFGPQCSGENEVPGVVTLDWLDVPRDAPGTEKELGEGTTTLRVKNSSEEEVLVRLTLTASDGGLGETKAPLATAVVEADGTWDVPVDIEALGLDLDAMRYSGQVQVRAAVEDPETEEELQLLFSGPLYFHKRPGNKRLAVYDEDVLGGAYNAGNFKGAELNKPQLLIPLLDPEEKTLVERVGWANTKEETLWLETPEGQIAAAQKNATEADFGRATGPSMPRATYTLCVSIEIDTIDSGYTNLSGVTEDVWITGNNSINVAGLGFRVQIGSTTYDTSPSTGCVTFSSGSSVNDVRVYAYTTDANGNVARTHNGAHNDTSSYPGSTFSWLLQDVVFTVGQTKYVYVGDHGDRWTSMAAVAWAMYRWHDSISNKLYHFAEIDLLDNPSCDNSNYSNDVANDISWVRLSTDTCSFPGQRRKFAAAHEYGHAMGYQFAERNGMATPGDDTHNVTPSSCTMGSGYSMETKEWSSIGAREGFADLVSARVWNDYGTWGTYRRFNTTYDLEKWNSGNTPQGYLRNVCCSGSNCATSLNNAATRRDWMLAFWDVYTNTDCSPSPQKPDMTRLWDKIIDQTGSGNSFFTYSQGAWDTLVSQGHVGSCYPDLWDGYACHNGIDFLGSLHTCN